MRIWLGWRMWVRSLGIRIGLIKKPLVDDYVSHQHEFALEQRLLTIVNAGRKYLPKAAIDNNRRYAALVRLNLIIFAITERQHPARVIHRTLINTLQQEALVDVFFADAPFQAMFRNDEQALRTQVVKDGIEVADAYLREQEKHHPYLGTAAAMSRYHEIC